MRFAERSPKPQEGTGWGSPSDHPPGKLPPFPYVTRLSHSSVMNCRVSGARSLWELEVTAPMTFLDVHNTVCVQECWETREKPKLLLPAVPLCLGHGVMQQRLVQAGEGSSPGVPGGDGHMAMSRQVPESRPSRENSGCGQEMGQQVAPATPVVELSPTPAAPQGAPLLAAPQTRTGCRP